MDQLQHINPNVLFIAAFVVIITGFLLIVLLHPIGKWIVDKKYKAALMMIFSGLFLEMLISPLRGFTWGGFTVSSAGGFICYMAATFFLIKKYRDKVNAGPAAWFVLLGLFLLQGTIRICYFKSTLISLPDFLMHALGILAGYSLYERRRLVHKLSLAASVMALSFVCFYGYNLWIYNLNYGTFDGHIHFKGPEITGLHAKDNSDVKIEKGKYAVLDFWFVGCGACMREFPKFQQLYSSYKTNPRVQFYSVNKYMPTDKTDSFKYLENIGYTFPMAASPGKDLIKEFGINGYPTTIVLDQDGNVIYRGDVKGAQSTIKSLL